MDSYEYVVGVDVGTGSARAGVFDLRGEMVATADHPIQIFRPHPDHVEHSSIDIWHAVCQAVREALRKGSVNPQNVVGISFDATCSLVALDREDNPVTVSLDGEPSHNVLVWMDHRAEKEADEINRTKHRVLDYVGGGLSPEQEPPKLLWLKRNLSDTWQHAAKFFDLADYLVYEACKQNVRSLCTVVCKWTYMGHEGEGGSWDESFFKQIDLQDLFVNGRAGDHIRPMGTKAGELTEKAARELGLLAGTTVGVGIIDAHAGGIGSLGMTAPGEAWSAEQINNTLALIGGTSSCHMAVSPKARFIPGVWGPYYSAMIPGVWLTEGGQSATGALIDHVISNHAYSSQLKRDAAARNVTIYELLNEKVAALKAAWGEGFLTGSLHVLPDHLGNRSPRADSHARGMMSGLALDSSFESLALLYYATIQGVAYGTRHIIEALNAGGYEINRIHACGGGTKNPTWLQEHADITGCPVYVAKDCETVLLGTSILAAVAAGRYPSILEAMHNMSPAAAVVKPDTTRRGFHNAKYEVFKLMYEHQQEYKRMVKRAGTGQSDAHSLTA
ncbi:MAG: FGGY-family carbohydrate kinase [Pyrinomonadaceae bacterium]|nr:FGGY-family carbohydrate kinase [Pyrinomonadaceae bacterium]